MLVFGLYSLFDCCAGVDIDSLCACRRNFVMGRVNVVNEVFFCKCVKLDLFNVLISVCVVLFMIGIVLMW